MRNTSTHYRRPYRPRPIRLLNAMGRMAKHLGPVGVFNIESLLTNAQKQLDRRAFQDLSFTTVLEKQVDAINRQAQLHTLGRIIQQQRVVQVLKTRLRVEAFYDRYPEIENVQLPPILAIAALQRTGTTKLHRLLASDPDARALRSWEALNPVPLAGESKGEHHIRLKQARQAVLGLRYIAPDFFAIHPIEPEAPEEDILLLDLAFMSQTAEATLHVPAFASWLEMQDHKPAYDYLKKILKVLQFLEPATSHWVLKTPNHMEHLNTLMAVFPQTTIIQTHRDPQQTMGSFCSMVAHGRGIMSDNVDPLEVGTYWLRKVRRMIDRSNEDRTSIPDSRIVDIFYGDLMQDPIAAIEHIYQVAGLRLQPRNKTEIQARQQANDQHKYGRHIYRSEDFGLSRDLIDATFSDYTRQFSIPEEF